MSSFRNGKESVMKAFKNFFNRMFSDHGMISSPPEDAASLMYSYITFTGERKSRKDEPLNKGGKLINFTEYKLRRA